MDIALPSTAFSSSHNSLASSERFTVAEFADM
jgi:hypothetical protein